MELTIREYRPEDRKGLEQCMLGLQDFVHNLDPLERLRGIEGFDVVAYIDVLMNLVKQQQGSIFLADLEGKAVGCIAVGIISDDEADHLSSNAHRSGRVIELFVSPDTRNMGIGKKLMERAEHYLKEKNCDSVRIEVFAPNTDAHAFYEKIGYHDRSIDMLKML